MKKQKQNDILIPFQESHLFDMSICKKKQIYPPISFFNFQTTFISNFSFFDI